MVDERGTRHRKSVSAVSAPPERRAGWVVRPLPRRQVLGEGAFAWLMVSPSLVLLLALATFPLLFLIGMGTFRIQLTSVRGEAWAGLQNFATMLVDPRFWNAVQLMLIYTVSTVTLQVVVGLALAMAFFRSFRGEGLLRLAVLLPMILAPVVVGLAWRTLMLTPHYGLVDFVSSTLGFGSHPWLSDPTLALVSVIVIHTWQWTPFAFLVFLASLNALPREPLEAALIDQAGPWQRFWYVILPMLRTAIVVVVVLRTVIALRAFDAIFAATGGGPGTATEILNLYVYRVSFGSLNLGYGAALATVLLFVTAGTSWLFFRVRGAR